MNKYKYYSFDTKQTIEIEAEDILLADDEYEKQTGVVPLNNPRIITEFEFDIDKTA